MNNYTAKYALKMLIETKGVEQLKNGNQCMAFLKDMASKDKVGLENIQVVFERHLQQLLIDASFGSNTEQQNAIDTLYNRLIDRFSMQTTKEICSIFAFALNWNVVIKSSADNIYQDESKAFSPVTILQPKQPNQISHNQNKTQSFRKVKIIVGVVVLLAIIVVVGTMLITRKNSPSKEINEVVKGETNSKATTPNELTVSESIIASSELAINSEVDVKETKTIERESMPMMNDNIPEGSVAFNDHYY